MLAPGHPLVNALVQVVLDDAGEAMLRGAALEDDRSASSYAVVVARSSADGSDELVATRWSGAPGALPERVDVGLLSALPAAATAATEDEQAALTEALEHAQSLTGHVMAVAYVRGTASAETAERWERARASLIARTPTGNVANLADAPWDLRVEKGGAWRFLKAVPAEDARLRAHEVAEQGALGEFYKVEVEL